MQPEAYQEVVSTVAIIGIVAVTLGTQALAADPVSSLPLATAIAAIAGIGGYRISKNGGVGE